jgi:hypothetical protein
VVNRRHDREVADQVKLGHAPAYSRLLVGGKGGQ